MRKSQKINNGEFKSINIYKAGSVPYYRDALEIIVAICYDYDGCRTAKNLKELIDDIKDYAVKALNKKKLAFIYKGSSVKDADRTKS